MRPGRTAVVQVADKERIIIAHVVHMNKFPPRLRVGTRFLSRL